MSTATTSPAAAPAPAAPTATATASAPAPASAPASATASAPAPASQHAAPTAPSPTVAGQPTRRQVTRAPQGGEEVQGPSVLQTILMIAGIILILLMAAYIGLVTYKELMKPTAQQNVPPATAPTAPAPGTTQVNPGTAVDNPGTTQVAPGTTVVAPGTTQVNPGTTVVTPGTTQVNPGTTVVAPGTTQVNPGTTVVQQPNPPTVIYAVDPALKPGLYAQSQVAADDATLVTVRKHKDNHEVIFVGPGKDLPRKIIVASCPQVAPIQVNVPVPSVENKIYIPQPPVPPSAPVPPTPPSAPVGPQVQQQTSIPVQPGQPVRQVVQRNYCH